MAVDITDQTTAQYRQHIESMSIEKLQRCIDYYEQPGYNCPALITADGVISPRTKILREVLDSKIKTKEKVFSNINIKRELTAKQWAKKGFILNTNAVGTKKYTNSRCLMKAIYYREFEVHEDKKAASKFLKMKGKTRNIEELEKED